MRLTRFAYSPRTFDIMFAAIGLIAILLITLGATAAAQVRTVPAGDWTRAATLLAVIVVSGIIATSSSKLDKRNADEYMYTALTKSAFIGMLGQCVTVSLWDVLFSDAMGDLSGTGVLSISLAAWAIGYFYTRIRGTSA